MDIRIPLSPCKQDGTPIYELAPGDRAPQDGKLSLHFVQGDAPERMARTVQAAAQIL